MHQAQHQRRRTAGHSKHTWDGGRQGGAPPPAAVAAAAPPPCQRQRVRRLRRHPAERHRVVLGLLPRGEQLLCCTRRVHPSGGAQNWLACTTTTRCQAPPEVTVMQPPAVSRQQTRSMLPDTT